MIVRRRRAKTDDAAIRALVAAAFGRADEAALVDAIRRGGDDMIELVAEKDGQLAGHVLFSRMVSPPQTLGLAPVAVRPRNQREGIGSALIRRGVALASEEEWRAVFVLGDPGYYARFGFRAEDASRFVSPYAGANFMVRALGNHALPAAQRAEYARAFAAFG